MRTLEGRVPFVVVCPPSGSSVDGVGPMGKVPRMAESWLVASQRLQAAADMWKWIRYLLDFILGMVRRGIVVSVEAGEGVPKPSGSPMQRLIGAAIVSGGRKRIDGEQSASGVTSQSAAWRRVGGEGSRPAFGTAASEAGASRQGRRCARWPGVATLLALEPWSAPPRHLPLRPLTAPDQGGAGRADGDKVLTDDLDGAIGSRSLSANAEPHGTADDAEGADWQAALAAVSAVGADEANPEKGCGDGVSSGGFGEGQLDIDEAETVENFLPSVRRRRAAAAAIALRGGSLTRLGAPRDARLRGPLASTVTEYSVQAVCSCVAMPSHEEVLAAFPALRAEGPSQRHSLATGLWAYTSVCRLECIRMLGALVADDEPTAALDCGGSPAESGKAGRHGVRCSGK
eukprot:GHVT01052748.1.p1 GENE.GHVT01052748.1~~GHVT01052748.1.p1  ORF type:complete len:401 (+),score=90.97 GHVT01052748.1:616-1818(+)